MKNIIILLLSVSIFICPLNAEEEKSYLKTRDAISMNVKKYFEAASKEDIQFAENFYADNVEVYINDLIIKGKKNISLDSIKFIKN